MYLRLQTLFFLLLTPSSALSIDIPELQSRSLQGEDFTYLTQLKYTRSSNCKGVPDTGTSTILEACVVFDSQNEDENENEIVYTLQNSGNIQGSSIEITTDYYKDSG